jgi:mono/diheme cytochrome c family protein
MFERFHWIGHSLVVTAAIALTPAFAADPDHGETLVKRWCATCHLVVSDQKDATTQAPTFASVAKRPGFDAARIALFLLDPHPKMPNMALSRDEAGDIAAYIATLK